MALLHAFAFILAVLVPCAAQEITQDGETYDCTDESEHCISGSVPGDIFADSPSVSLLQRKASLTKANHLHAVGGAPRQLADVATVKQEAFGAHRAHVGSKTPLQGPVTVRVVHASATFTAVQVMISLIFFVGVIFFLATERRSESGSMAEHSRRVAKALDNRRALDMTQNSLQDFLPDSDGPFVLAVDGRKPLTFNQLRTFIASKEADVSRFGVSGSDRLAVILGDGPESVVAFWAFSAQCTFCPINRKASNEEISFTLQDLPAKAVVLCKEDADRASGFLTISCTPDSVIAGLFTLVCADAHQQAKKTLPSRSSIGLVIQTSGTTKKPKQVPLTHENLILCGSNIAEMIKLEPGDRALNFLPLFHIGGIMNSIVAPVMSKSSVVCGTHFAPADVFEWILLHRPTWYFGSPTTHMVLISEQVPPKEQILRLIRNATAALLPSTAQEMGQFWKNCEILPGYGMSECTPIASHQYGKEVRLASSGPGAGPEISIDDKGEVLIKGPVVFSGYDVRKHMDEDPNTSAFDGGWFRTGDAGMIDNDGYLSITGRFKEIIIRGGENISPFEVEDAVIDKRFKALMAFSVRHTELGEVVGLAVETSVEDDALGDAFKSLLKQTTLDSRRLPQIIVKMDQLPRGLAGKLKRIGLQAKLGLPDQDSKRSGPIAYTYTDGKLTALDVYADDAEVQVDSLGLAKREGGAKIPAHVQHAIMSMYGIVAIMVVSFHTNLHLQSCPWFILIFGGNINGGVHWTMQAFMACASFLNSKEPFQPTRVVVLLVLYFCLAWPVPQLGVEVNYLVGREPMGTFFAQSGKRWFVLVMVFSYVTFAAARHFPLKGLQCLSLVALSTVLVVAQPSDLAFTNVAPAWVKFWFETTGVNGWFAWSGCTMVYFIVGHYGHEAWARIQAHPLASDLSFQRKLGIACPILFIAAQVATFIQPEIELVHGHGANFRWATCLTIIGDQFVSISIMALLLISVRNAPVFLARVGSSALGIYIGVGLIYYVAVPIPQNTVANPHTVIPSEASFAVIVDRFGVIPPLQDVLAVLVNYWPAQIAVFLVYVAVQIALLGIPCQKAYLFGLNALDAICKSLGAS